MNFCWKKKKEKVPPKRKKRYRCREGWQGSAMRLFGKVYDYASFFFQAVRSESIGRNKAAPCESPSTSQDDYQY
jgi:hypothetical protein